MANIYRELLSSVMVVLPKLALNIEVSLRLVSGNVSLDCARILTKNRDVLAESDISTTALEVLRRTHLSDVSIVGRRGHIQSSFTIKELRELSRLDGVSLRLLESELSRGLSEASAAEANETRSKKRIVELLNSLAMPGSNTDDKITIMLRFLLQPKEIVCNEAGAVSGVRFERTVLEGPPYAQRARGTGETELIPCDIVIKSLGYLNTPPPGVPFDSRSGAVPHMKGRISNSIEGNLRNFNSTGWYVTGWLKRGPTGTHSSNAGVCLSNVG